MMKVLLVYLVGVLASMPVYAWALRTLCRVEGEEEEPYCKDHDLYMDPRKPNYPLAAVVVLMGGLFWPVVILFAVFAPLTFVLMDKMGQLHPKDEE